MVGVDSEGERPPWYQSRDVYRREQVMGEHFGQLSTTRLGAMTYIKHGDKLEGGIVPDQWISPLMQANNGKLRTSAWRFAGMGQTFMPLDLAMESRLNRKEI